VTTPIAEDLLKKARGETARSLRVETQNFAISIAVCAKDMRGDDEILKELRDAINIRLGVR
jgi:hypothetical protein